MLKKSFVAFFPLLYCDIKVDRMGGLKTADFSIHWNSLPVLSYVLFYYFIRVSVPFSYFSDPDTPTQASGIFVEAVSWPLASNSRISTAT